ncbi:MAG: DinB family protein [Mucilaginibacter sp.]
MLKEQYRLVLSARHALFAYCHTIAPADLYKPIPEFNNSSICNLLNHSANTYIHWLVKVAQQQPHSFFEADDMKSVVNVENAFRDVDAIVANFLHKFKGRFDVPSVFNHPTTGTPLTLTRLELFTHVITHEFHHKGQILTMSRLLGYIPVDTDIIRT